MDICYKPKSTPRLANLKLRTLALPKFFFNLFIDLMQWSFALDRHFNVLRNLSSISLLEGR